MHRAGLRVFVFTTAVALMGAGALPLQPAAPPPGDTVDTHLG